MQLVIAEKPSVAMSIAAVIGADERKDGYMEGGGYLVGWCVGHLAGLADASHYGDYKKWRREDLPILPRSFETVVAPDKAEPFHTLKKLMHRKDVTDLICATDAGREGELIFRFVYELAGCEKPFRRLWISSMEESAIKKGFADLKDGHDYDPLYQSALCRAKADWLIGINATRLFSVLYNHTLNVGRVQTPTLSLLVERDNAIQNFQKKKYYVVHIAGANLEAVSPPYTEKGEAEKLRADCEGETAACTCLVREEKTENPPRLFDLTSLQREANRLYGYTAKQTLDYTQSLYEKKQLSCIISRLVPRSRRQSCQSVFYWNYRRQIFKWFFNFQIKRYADDPAGAGVYCSRHILSFSSSRQDYFSAGVNIDRFRVRPYLSLNYTFYAC